jgi:hypothetical protein
MTAVPVDEIAPEEVQVVVDDEGVIRLSELAEEMGTRTASLHSPVMELVVQGKAAVFPIGDVVEVRSES